MRLLNSGLKTTIVMAAVFLLAACATAPEESAESSGQGGGATTAQPVAAAPQPKAEPSAPKVAPGSQEDLVLNVGDRVFFDFDKFDITAEAQATLQRQAAWMNSNPQTTIVVEGHCDERGTREYNLGLGERRASAIREYLVNLGVAPARVEVISYGKERPVALGHAETAWSQNRRGVTVVASN
jgi:peptidoglycan-associated lipoprotein